MCLETRVAGLGMGAPSLRTDPKLRLPDTGPEVNSGVSFNCVQTSVCSVHWPQLPMHDDTLFRD